MDQKTFDELIKEGEISLILMDGGQDLTKEQMRQVKAVAKKQSEQKRTIEGREQRTETIPFLNANDIDTSSFSHSLRTNSHIHNGIIRRSFNNH